MEISPDGPRLSPHEHQHAQQQQNSPGHGYQHCASTVDATFPSARIGHRRFPHSNTPAATHGLDVPNCSPGHQPQPDYAPSARILPQNNDVTADNIDQVYASFILYCNPCFPSNHDTAELKRNFKKPPMSDNQTFDPYVIFELLKKFEKGEIKTWIQLALDMGVEPPDVDKGQSTQKVQQYTVRLKRWMRGMHIDSFFDFLQGKPHSYYTDIPGLDDSYHQPIRDGVSLEEDLAIRALDPTVKPKRGRKRTDVLDDDDRGTPTPKKPCLDTSLTFDSSRHPSTLYTDSATALSAHDHNLVHPNLWPIAHLQKPNATQKKLTPNPGPNTITSPLLRWQMSMHEAPATPHSLSASSPIAGRLADSAFDGPLSAITPSGSRRPRRRHGPAVSSAWPGSGSGSSCGKLRGRPPQNRSVHDGPYVTFPANPSTKEQVKLNINRTSPATAGGGDAQPPGSAQHQNQAHRQPVGLPIVPSSAHEEPAHRPASSISPKQPHLLSVNGRMGQQLSLKVPQPSGGPIHPVSPTMLINGDTNCPDKQMISVEAAPASLEVTRETLKRLLAADLLRADITGRKRLRGHEARVLADDLLIKMGMSRLSKSGSGNDDDDGLRAQGLANWLGLSSQVGLGQGSVASGIKRIDVQKYRVSHDGYESPIDVEDSTTEDDGVIVGDGSKTKEIFDISWSLTLGACIGKFVVKGLAASTADWTNDGKGGCPSGGRRVSPEDRIKELEARLREKDREVQLWRQRVIDAIL